jgi:tetratricopeptide (TPR) repeat protein
MPRALIRKESYCTNQGMKMLQVPGIAAVEGITRMILTVLVIAALSLGGCASNSFYYRPAPSVAKETSARNALSQLSQYRLSYDIFRGNTGFSLARKFTAWSHSESGLQFDIQGERIECRFQSMEPSVFSLPTPNGPNYHVYLGPACDWSVTVMPPLDQNTAINFANTLFVLKEKTGQVRSPMDDPVFRQVVNDYRARKANNQLQLSEQARRYRVQAEAAVQERRFADAERYFDELLKIEPWWPTGHYNRALILGEIGNYDEAAFEMKKYLALEPDAPDARAARDQIYVWESK